MKLLFWPFPEIEKTGKKFLTVVVIVPKTRKTSLGGGGNRNFVRKYTLLGCKINCFVEKLKLKRYTIYNRCNQAIIIVIQINRGQKELHFLINVHS